MNKSSNLLKRSEVAILLNLKPSALEAWAVRGGGPLMVKMGRAVRYRPEDVEAFILASLRNNTSQKLDGIHDKNNPLPPCEALRPNIKTVLNK